MTPAGFCALPLPLAQLSLPAVLKCGQSFRWSTVPADNEYRLCLPDRVVCLRQSPTTLFYRALFPLPPSPQQDAQTLVWINDYFQLGVDLTSLYEDWAQRDSVFAALRGRFGGIRILRQDPWETLVSFICSSNNNISRITKMVQALCKQYSPPLLSTPDGDITYHPFPPPSALAAPEVSATLRKLGFGYRAEFIQRTAKMLVDAQGSTSEKWLMNLRSLSTHDARSELLKFIGVGRKVADCVLLMSLDKQEVVPIDTHVHQIAVKHYGLKASKGKATMTPKLYEELNSKFFQVWGEYAGWAHSIMFTADLRSFSAYGLPPSSPTLEIDPILSPTKRKRKTPLIPVTQVKTVESLDGFDELPAMSLAERVKKRRRVT